MKLKHFLREHKPAILNGWIQELMETYPSETKKFLQKNKNSFSNPLGNTLSQEMGFLYDELLNGMDPEKIDSYLDKIIRIRAVQEFSPSLALSFIFKLKKVVRDQLAAKKVSEDGFSQQVEDLESQIDEMGLRSFDIYMNCREKIYELRANETKARAHMLLKRAKMICEIPGPDPV